MKFIFTGQRQSLLEQPPPLLISHVSQAVKGLVKAWCSGSGFSAACIFASLGTGTAVGEMGMQSEAAQSVSRNSARAASFHLLQLCEQNHNLCVYVEKKV